MSNVQTPPTDEEEKEDTLAPISLKEFLEKIHPSVVRQINELWQFHNSNGYRRRRISTPDLRLHCQVCEGERTFRCASDAFFDVDKAEIDFSLHYKCGDCHEQVKYYSLLAAFEDNSTGKIYKYGELPPFGVPVPNKVLRLFGRDSGIFLKGRQCENLGYGVAAFAYYRRVVENHKNDIFDEIIKVCKTVNASKAIVDELQEAKKEISFSKAIDTVKSALPQGLLINGHNPLLALHGALSVGLHDESDDACLEAAHAVRLVLTDLVERIGLLKQDNKHLNDAVQLLLKKKA
ncbi:hypothetical protein GHK78_19410 [Sinorhizobium meliloti]|uniref:hypothetical protein n=1 Tax=Rhizobium meliloti TaxID=382 RepID=UPI001294BF6A|nr:hypothetical protein [Sinorhizobium meliloti]MQX65144.1 hypothetical protein [Sinorhizobium meliloti]